MLSKLGAAGILVGAVAGILSGVACGLTHLAAGDLLDHYQECLALIVAGVAVFSPGMNVLKEGAFARPGGQKK